MSYSVFVQKSLIVSLFELILPMFATREPRRTSSPFKVILTEEKDIICFHCRKNKILAAKLQMFSDFAIDIRRFCSIRLQITIFSGLKAQKKSARAERKRRPELIIPRNSRHKRAKAFCFSSIFAVFSLFCGW